MAIDTSGKWWIGSDPMDIREYLQAYSQEGYPTSQFRLCECTCGSKTFKLEADDNEGAAKRECVKCKKSHFICEGDEYWADAEPEPWVCIECNSTDANVGIGFAMYADEPTEVKWIYVGCRCSKCGILGCFAGWKIGYSPSAQLLDRV